MKYQRIPSNYYVILPAYNESRYIGKVLKRLKKYTKNIIVVDDGSRDDTVDIASQYTPHVLHHAVNLGKGAAMKTGCMFAFEEKQAKAVIFMDSDAQHDPSEIFAFSRELSKGANLVFGTRKMANTMPVMRVLANTFASLLVQVFFGTYIPDIPSGYKAMTKNAFTKISWSARQYDVEMEIAARTAKYRLPFSVVPIKTIYHDLDKGMTFLDAARMMFQIVQWKIFI